jgi:hypothetical protein
VPTFDCMRQIVRPNELDGISNSDVIRIVHVQLPGQDYVDCKTGKVRMCSCILSNIYKSRFPAQESRGDYVHPSNYDLLAGFS